MSIATKRGDAGETNLIGHVRISKAAVRVEAYGTVDELIAAMGYARSICADDEIRDRTKQIQRELFAVCASLAAPATATGPIPTTSEMVERLTDDVHRLEAIDGVLRDWSLPGDHPAAAAYDVARTICRRAERNTTRLAEQESVPPIVLVYLNRLSDLLWLFGRVLETRAGINSALRRPGDPKGRWKRAW